MPTLYLVTYDICDEKRLRLVFKKMRGYGEHLQYSVFRCDLSEARKAQLIADLSDIVNCDEDQVLIFNLGPAEGYRAEMVDTVGLAYKPVVREAIVV